MEKTGRVHFWYIVGILIAIVILVMTDRWTDKPNFTTFLSNAATLTSLVLGMIAIFYSVVSNGDISESLGNIRSVSETVHQSNQRLGQFLIAAEALTETGRESTIKLESVSTSVEAHVVSLRAALDAVATQTTDMYAAVTVIPTRLGELESKFSEAAKHTRPATAAVLANDVALSDEQVRNFIAKSPLVANVLMYASVLSKETGKGLDLPTIVKELSLSTPDRYLQAYLMAMASLGIVQRDQVKDKAYTYELSFVHPVIVTDSEEYLKRYVQSHYREKASLLAVWQGRIAKLEKLFAD